MTILTFQNFWIVDGRVNVLIHIYGDYEVCTWGLQLAMAMEVIPKATWQIA